jgi:hypothetical protein
MVLTQKEAKVAQNLILDNILGRRVGTTLKSSLDVEGIDDMFGRINISEAAIESLSSNDTRNNNVVTPVGLGD